MVLTSAQMTATILSFISTLLITQVIGRFIDHNYDRLFKELDKNLKIKNALPEGMQSESLDQIVRQQLNAYILRRSQEPMGKQVMNRVRLMFIGVIAAAFLAWSVSLVLDGKIWLATATFLGTLSFGTYYFDRRSAWTKRGRVENTKYRAVLKGGLYSGGATLLDVLQDSRDNDSDVSIDYPRVAIISGGKAHVYKRSRSTGAVNIASGDDTSMVTEYEYEGTKEITEKDPITYSHKQAIINPEDIKTANVNYPMTAEMPLISRPIHEAVGIGKKVTRLFIK